VLTEEDKKWIRDQLEKVETTLPIEFHKWRPRSSCVSGAMPQFFARLTLKLSLFQIG